MSRILAVDLGTSALKMGVFTEQLEMVNEAVCPYEMNLYGEGYADIEPEKWWSALVECCRSLEGDLRDVGVLSLSVTTPGLVAMKEDGEALGPAILFLDGRSHRQAASIRSLVGETRFLAEGCNLPVSGGSSLASILWIRENQPEAWQRTAKFGHSNTYMVRRLTGYWAVDPSTASITGMYNTARNDLHWNSFVLSTAGIPEEKLPTLMHSHSSPGCVLPSAAEELGLPRECVVLCGGNDAVLAALSGGLTQAGRVSNVNGTCEITSVCIDRPMSSPHFNVRCHVIPGLWVTFFVLNSGGESLEWFRRVFCSELTQSQFYDGFVPEALARHFASEDPVTRDARLPIYEPYLQGSRYSLEQLTGSFSGLRLETTREMILLAMIRGNERYHGAHLEEVSGLLPLERRIVTSGGVATIQGYASAQKAWLADCDYQYQEQSSVMGAAILGRFYQTGKWTMLP
jgi:xylulokinase